jgi:hypothetical protein
MTEAELRTLIAQITADFLARQRAKRIMVLWAGALVGFPDAVASLQRLTDLGVRLDFAQTPSAQRLLNQDTLAGLGTPATGHFVLDHDILVVPTLTANLAAKVALGVADCLGSNVIADFIQTGKTVVVSQTSVDPTGAPKRSVYPTMPPAYAALLSDHLATLATYGVRLADADRLDEAVLALPAPTAESSTSPPEHLAAPAVPSSRVAGGVTPSRPPITAGRLVSYATIAPLAPGSIVRVAPGAIVTAQALDFAQARGIHLERQA